jgi:hypothetical protein
VDRKSKELIRRGDQANVASASDLRSLPTTRQRVPPAYTVDPAAASVYRYSFALGSSRLHSPSVHQHEIEIDRIAAPYSIYPVWASMAFDVDAARSGLRNRSECGLVTRR